MRSERKDAHYRRAKAAGYRARSAYKLLELDDRYHFLARSRRILDIGAWPGGWLQVAAERAPRDARIVGVDLQPLEPFADPRVNSIAGDIGDPGIADPILDLLGDPADLVLSDAAPKLTGIAATDDARLETLGLAVLEATGRLLRPGGTLVIKLFTGAAGSIVRSAIAAVFRSLRATRPDTSRRGTSEIYVVAEGRR